MFIDRTGRYAEDIAYVGGALSQLRPAQALSLTGREQGLPFIFARLTRASMMEARLIRIGHEDDPVAGSEGVWRCPVATSRASNGAASIRR